MWFRIYKETILQEQSSPGQNVNGEDNRIYTQIMCVVSWSVLKWLVGILNRFTHLFCLTLLMAVASRVNILRSCVMHLTH